MSTTKGRELSDKLEFAILREGRTWEDGYADVERMREDCSLICRHAQTHFRVAEDVCNGHPVMASPHVPIETANKLQADWEARCERQDAQAEKRIAELVAALPGQPGVITGVVFGGDPRGCTVKITLDERYHQHYDSWGRDGVCVPQT